MPENKKAVEGVGALSTTGDNTKAGSNPQLDSITKSPKMDSEEARILLDAAGGSIVTLQTAHDGIEGMIAEMACDKWDRSSAVWSSLTALRAGKIMERTQWLLSDEADLIAPIDNFSGEDAWKKALGAADPGGVIYGEALPWLRKAFRYGYYQALIDGDGGL